jgi:hypothetical protein
MNGETTTAAQLNAMLKEQKTIVRHQQNEITELKNRLNYRIMAGLEEELTAKTKYGNNWRLAALAGWLMFAYVLFLDAAKNAGVL